jgi:hypothetical protein
MVLRSIICCAALIAVASCVDPTNNLPKITGQYVLIGLDGVDGVSSDSLSGLLQVGWNVPPGTYDMRVALPVVDSFTAVGNYAWDGQTLTLTDSKIATPMSATKAGGLVIVQRGGHSFTFMQLVEFPH